MAKHLAVDRPYESLFICPSDTPQKTIDGFIEKIKTALAPSKGVLRGVQVWGRRRLTYPIKHHKDGLYIFIDFTGERGAPEAIKNLYHVTDFILRYQTMDKVNLRPPAARKSPTPEGTQPASLQGAPQPVQESPTKSPPSAQ